MSLELNSLRVHAMQEWPDGTPMARNKRAVFLARGGHAPGTACALEAADPYRGWCSGCRAYDEDDGECGCTCHRAPVVKGSSS